MANSATSTPDDVAKLKEKIEEQAATIAVLREQVRSLSLPLAKLRAKEAMAGTIAELRDEVERLTSVIEDNAEMMHEFVAGEKF